MRKFLAAAVVIVGMIATPAIATAAHKPYQQNRAAMASFNFGPYEMAIRKAANNVNDRGHIRLQHCHLLTGYLETHQKVVECSEDWSGMPTHLLAYHFVDSNFYMVSSDHDPGFRSQVVEVPSA